MIKFRAFRAIDEPETCRRFVEGHVNILKDYGIVNITSNNALWTSNASVYCVIAESDVDGEMVGGIRVQVADGVHPLPVEEAVGKMDPQVHEIVKHYAVEGTGELCGLWNSKTVAGMGLSILLVRAGISIINQLNFKTLVGICADYTMPMFTKVGFVVDRSLGNKGEFVYPNENYIARVLGILNASTLDTAEDYDKERMLNLREQPIQTKVEKGPKGEVEIVYDLKVKVKEQV